MKTTQSPITLIAGETLAAHRRVKMDTTAGQIIYADAGEECIGITAEAAASGDPLAICLWHGGETFKIEASAAVSALAVVYGADDGKISSTAIGSPLGTANAAASGAASVIEVLPQTNTLPGKLELFRAVITDANAADADIAAEVPYACLIVDWWIVSRDTTAANITPKNAGTAFAAALAKGTVDDVRVQGATIIAEYDAVAAGAALTVAASAVAPFDIFVLVART